MPVIISVKFRNSIKSYYFNPVNEKFTVGEFAIIETARGVEVGEVVKGNTEVADSEIVSPLKDIIRKATAKDIEKHKNNLKERTNLMDIAAKNAEKLNLTMKVVDAEYTFDRRKITIYYTAPERVDFRELVKNLAMQLSGRIEMRQIQETDDVKMQGALGVCGRPCCCAAFLNEYKRASIKMAKNQGLSLNPSNISGYCGKLMCCLNYENEVYTEMNKALPRVKAKVETTEGPGVVVATYPLKKRVLCKISDAEGNIKIKVFELNEINWNDKVTKIEEDDEDNE